MIDENEWQNVLQIAKDGTFSQAAKHRFISQPALPQGIRKIERELGMQIFDRSKTPVQLTEAGRIYVEAAGEIKRIRQSILQQVDDLSELRTGQVRVGSSRTRSVCILADAMAAFHKRYPEIQLSLVEGSNSRLKERILHGEVDFALLYEPLDDKLFQWLPVMDEHVFLAVPHDHPFAREYRGIQPVPYPRISFSRFDGLPFVALKTGRQMTSIYENLCKSTGAVPRKVFESDSILSAAEFCARGMGATLVTEMVIRRMTGMPAPFFFTIEEPTEVRHMVAAYGRTRALPRAARVFVEFLHN